MDNHWNHRNHWNRWNHRRHWIEINERLDWTVLALKWRSTTQKRELKWFFARRHLIWCLIIRQWNYWPRVIGRYTSDFAWYMSQLVLVFYGYCWEICQWFPWYMSQVVISSQAGVGRYASGHPWYMSQCLSIFIVLFFMHYHISYVLSLSPFISGDRNLRSIFCHNCCLYPSQQCVGPN